MWQGIHHQARIVYSSAPRHLLRSLPADPFASSLALLRTALRPDVRGAWPRLTLNKANPLVAKFVCVLLLCTSWDWSPDLPWSQVNWICYFLLQRHWLDWTQNPFSVVVRQVINLLKTHTSQWEKHTNNVSQSEVSLSLSEHSHRYEHIQIHTHASQWRESRQYFLLK